MDEDIFYQTKIGDGRILCVSTLSRESFFECASTAFSSDRGFFVYERDAAGKAGIAVLAKLASLEAAFRFVELLQSVTEPAASIPSTGG